MFYRETPFFFVRKPFSTMDTAYHLTARLLPDNPWLIRARLAKDYFKEKRVEIFEDVYEEIVEKETMTVEEARGKGCKVDPNLSVSDLIEVEWITRIKKVKGHYETRLQSNTKRDEGDWEQCATPSRESRIQNVRVELASAAENPRSYVSSNKLRELIDDEIEHWRNHNMSKSNVHPIVMVLLGVYDRKGENIFVRDTFYIEEYKNNKLTVITETNKYIIIDISPEIYNKCIIRNFTLFTPSNFHLYTIDSGEKVI